MQAKEDVHPPKQTSSGSRSQGPLNNGTQQQPEDRLHPFKAVRFTWHTVSWRFSSKPSKEISRSDILWQWIWIHILDLMTSLSLSHWLLRQPRSTWAPTGGLRILNSPKDANQGKRLPDVSICACVLLVLNQNAYFVWGRILLLNPLLFCLYTHQSYFTSQTEKRYHVNSGSISCSKHLVRCPGHCMTMNIL